MTITATTPTTEQTTTTRDDGAQARPLTIDSLACMEAINGLQEMLTARSIFEIENDPDDPDFAAFAAGAVGLARLATALHEQRASFTPAPADPSVRPLARTVEELRATVEIILSEPDSRAPATLCAFTHETMLGFVDGLPAAVAPCPLPDIGHVNQEAGQALGRLAALALALHEAASAVSAQIHQRVYDLNRALGRDPYDQRPWGDTHTETAVARAMESVVTPDGGTTA